VSLASIARRFASLSHKNVTNSVLSDALAVALNLIVSAPQFT
jgi:hypothetical protein